MLQKRVLQIIPYLKEEEINLVICHNAVLRVLYSFFNKIDNNQLPHLNIPLHTLFKIEVKKNIVSIDRFKLL